MAFKHVGAPVSRDGSTLRKLRWEHAEKAEESGGE